MRINSRPWHLLAFSALVLGTSPAAAESTQRQHGAHVHGEGLLEVAVEGSDLFIALRIPAANVVGFEHAPANEEQRSRVAAAEERFRDGARLLDPEAAAGCTLVSSEARLSVTEHDGHDRGHAHDEKNEHAREHAHDTEHEQDRSASGYADDDAHSELQAEYRFRCESPAALSAIDVRLFDALLDTRSLEALVVTPRYQGAIGLTPDQTRLPLAR